MPRWHVDRRCRRFDISVPALCRLSSDSEGQTRTPMTGLTGNLSELGALVRLPERIPPGSQISVEFSFPQFGAITVDAIVVWAKEPPEGQGDLPFHHGLRFLRPETALRVLSLTQSPAPAQPQKAPVQGDRGQKAHMLQRITGGQPPPPLPASRKGYEILVKFQRKAWPVLQQLLESAFEDINITETKDEEILLAYCKFYGNLQELDRRLEELQQSALVGLGDPQEAKLLNFFITLRDVANRSSGPLKKRSSVHVTGLSPSWRKPLAILVLAGVGLFVASQIGVLPRPSPPKAPGPLPQPLERVQPSVLQWQPYVEPAYHKDWFAVQEKYKLSDKTMLDLFHLIKRIDAYNPGHSLSDLTRYPKAVDRAMGLLILKGVTDVTGLRAFLLTLQAYFASGIPFPDEPESLTETRYGALATLDKTFAQRIILAFYEQLLGSNNAFTKRLLQELHRLPS